MYIYMYIYVYIVFEIHICFNFVMYLLCCVVLRVVGVCCCSVAGVVATPLLRWRGVMHLFMTQGLEPLGICQSVRPLVSRSHWLV